MHIRNMKASVRASTLVGKSPFDLLGCISLATVFLCQTPPQSKQPMRDMYRNQEAEERISFPDWIIKLKGVV